MSTPMMAEMFRTINAVHQQLAESNRITGQLEGKLSTFIDQLELHDKRTTELEVRTRKVEGRLHWYSGVGSILGLIAGLLGSRMHTN